MKTAIECVFKGVKKIPSGSFVNSNGETINYNSSSKLIFDQLINGIPKETILKISNELGQSIVNTCKAYDKIVLNLDITIYGNDNISVVICSVEKK